MKEYITAPFATGEQIKEIRKKLKMTQKEFAAFVCASVPTIERWERSKDRITGPVVTLLTILMMDSGIAKRMEFPEEKQKIRLNFMYENFVCTVIDADEMKRTVKIKNYTDNLMFRAFGKNTEPSFEEYEEFLESRCFPGSRDKIKLVLEDLDLPFYDPYLIIEKTEGRMAEDRFWIRIDR